MEQIFSAILHMSLTVKSRIKNVLQYRKKARWISIMGILFVIVITMGLLFSPKADGVTLAGTKLSEDELLDVANVSDDKALVDADIAENEAIGAVIAGEDEILLSYKEVVCDLDGDKLQDTVEATNYYNDVENSYVNLKITLGNGTVLNKTYEGNVYTHTLMAGDLSGDGKDDIMIFIKSYTSNFGAGYAHVLYVSDGEILEYPNNYLKNKAITLLQPDSFAEQLDNDFVGASIIENRGFILLRLIIPIDVWNNIGQYIDASYTKTGWQIDACGMIDAYDSSPD